MPAPVPDPEKTHGEPEPKETGPENTPGVTGHWHMETGLDKTGPDKTAGMSPLEMQKPSGDAKEPEDSESDESEPEPVVSNKKGKAASEVPKEVPKDASVDQTGWTDEQSIGWTLLKERIAEIEKRRENNTHGGGRKPKAVVDAENMLLGCGIGLPVGYPISNAMKPALRKNADGQKSKRKTSATENDDEEAPAKKKRGPKKKVGVKLPELK